MRSNSRSGWVLAARGGVVVLTMAGLLTACGGNNSSNSGGGGAKTLNLALTEGVFSDFNPWAAGNGINLTLWNNGALYDSLTRLDGDGNVKPGLATEWKQSPDGTETTLTLRQGVKFDDGTPVDGDAVKANLDYGVAHPEGAECNGYLTGMVTKVDSPTQVTVKTPVPVPGLLQDFAQCAGWMVNPASLGSKSLTTTPDGSGPYTLDTSASVAGSKWTYVKRKNHWDAASFPFDKIVVTSFTDPTAADNAAKSGQVDFLQKLDPNDKASGFTVVAGEPDQYGGFYISDANGKIVKALGDLRVREAMNYAVDRDAYKEAFVGKYGQIIGSTPFSQNYAGYSDQLTSYYSYDVNKAKTLLQEAGYADGFSADVLVDPSHQKQAQALAGFLSDVGIKLNLKVHSTDFITQMFSGKWPIVYGNYTLNPAQLQTLNGILGPSGFWNPQHIDNPKFTSLLSAIARTTDETEQGRLYAELGTTAAEQAWTINPVLLATTMGYNDHKLAVDITSGVPVPMLYNITPK